MSGTAAPPDPGALAPASLGTTAARKLATTTKSVPMTAQTSPRWLLRMLPWVQVRSGTYRVNRRRTYPHEAGAPASDRYAEAEIALVAGHTGEADLPGTFVDYDPAPREYPLSLAQTRLRVHTRVADLYNHPMDQHEQQLRLTIEALRERQEHELLHHPEFGLLHQADPAQRRRPRTGPPTPDDLDDLLSRRRRSRFFLAHPRAIAAFGRECTRRGIYPRPVEVEGHPVLAWRGVPLLPSDKIPVTGTNASAILVLRTGEEHQGVVGLRRTGLPDEREPGLSVRRTEVDPKGTVGYLVSTYFSAAVLVPDALGILEPVEIGH